LCALGNTPISVTIHLVLLTQLLDTLEAHHGPQSPNWPADPYLFLVWWHCGYPASDAACAKGWESLKTRIGLEPDRLLAADPSQLALALKPGGMVPELRALRLKEIAARVQNEFGGDLTAALKGLSIPQARAALKKFPNIAGPGADRILLFGGLSAVPAVPSNCPHVLVRIYRRQLPGHEHENYSRDYAFAQEIIAAEVPEKFDARMRTYLLLKCHGQQLCKRSGPKCSACPVASSCAWALSKSTTPKRNVKAV
jgi:endonuclease III